jgi:hypothetical protein
MAIVVDKTKFAELVHEVADAIELFRSSPRVLLD